MGDLDRLDFDDLTCRLCGQRCYTRGCRCPSCRATKTRTSRNYYLRKHGDSTPRLTAAERQQLVDQGLIDEEGAA